MCYVAAHQPDGRRTLSVQADITGSTLRLILRLDSLHLEAQASRSTRICVSLSPLVLAFLVYGRPETVPSISPVSARSAGALAALRNTALIVAVPVLLGALARLPMGILADRFGARILFAILDQITDP